MNDTNINYSIKQSVPEIEDMVMRMADNEISHCIIYSQFPHRFANCSPVLNIKGVRLHPLNITLLTKRLKNFKEKRK